jgi:hypothetical protein
MQATDQPPGLRERKKIKTRQAIRREAFRLIDENGYTATTVERVHWADYMAAGIGFPAAYDYRSQRGAYALHRATNWVARVAGPDNRTVFRPTEMSVVVRQAIPKPGGRPAIVPVEGRSRGTESPLWLRTECSLEHHRSHTWNRPQSGIE